MSELDDLIRAVTESGYEVFWLGAAAPEQVARLESLLEVKLPASFKRFLMTYGGGGVVAAEISGIEENDAGNDSGGTVSGDTKECRSRFDLPKHLVVIYFHEDEVCWCLDASRFQNDECPIVSYSVFSRIVDRTIAPNFDAFMLQHMALYASSTPDPRS